MKKKYISPQTVSLHIGAVLPIAASQFNATDGTQTITVSTEEADEFTSRRSDVWADEENDEY